MSSGRDSTASITSSLVRTSSRMFVFSARIIF